MRRFVLGWKMLGLEQSLGSRIVTYADDLVILCRRGKAEEALQQLREIMRKLSRSTRRKHESAKCRKESSTSWATRSGECTLREPARRAWDIGHRRRALSAWSRMSMS